MMKSSNTKKNNLNDIREWALGQFALGRESHHGPDHWDKVLSNGKILAGRTPGADVLVVELFALLHDCRRTRDGYDINHGRKAAEGLKEIRGSLIFLSDEQFGLLESACRGHTDGDISEDPTIGCCWDADRLELSRVGIKPEQRFMSTQAARDILGNGDDS